MSKIVINDMSYNEELDRQAFAAVMGGWGWSSIKRLARKGYRYRKTIWKNRKYAKQAWKRISGWF